MTKKTRKELARDVDEIMKKCMKCSQIRHFVAGSYSKTAIQEITEDDEDDTVFLGSVELKQSKDALLAEDKPPWFKIDSGADTSVMSEATFEALRNKPKLSIVRNTLQSPGGVVATRGQFNNTEVLCGGPASPVM